MQENLYSFLLSRGLLKDFTANIQDLFNSGKMISGYLGTDPTATSLHVGHLAVIMLLRNFQRFGHKPYILVGGATGMIGDPSFKNAERKFLSEDVLLHNQECLKKQLERFLDFSSDIPNRAEMVNNMDWLGKVGIIEFLREAGKEITVNYMESKESVKKRIISGISFTEFSYQLLQAYDFYYLFSNFGVELQMGGSDQWGNITTGVELIRKKTGQAVHALSIPLLAKADGTKFGKSDGNNVWLDPTLTSPYNFYQFWINCSDEDAKKFIYIFTTLPNDEIEELITKHDAQPKQRILQKTIAEEMMILVHGEKELEQAKTTSEILFGNADLNFIKSLTEEQFAKVVECLPKVEINRDFFRENRNAYDLMAIKFPEEIFSSKADLKRAVLENSVFVNKKLLDNIAKFNVDELLFDEYILVQRGSKKFYIIVIK